MSKDGLQVVAPQWPEDPAGRARDRRERGRHGPKCRGIEPDLKAVFLLLTGTALRERRRRPPGSSRSSQVKTCASVSTTGRRRCSASPVLSKYNPHGVLIGLEKPRLCRAWTGLSVRRCAPSRRRRASRLGPGWVFTAGGGVTLVLLVLFSGPQHCCTPPPSRSSSYLAKRVRSCPLRQRSPRGRARGPRASRWRSSSWRPPKLGGARSTPPSSRSSAPEPGSRRASSSNDPTNQEVTLTPRDTPILRS